MRKRWIVLVPLILLAMLLLIALGGQVARLLWNWLLPPLFGWREVTFWQALGILALCRILFGGFGIRGASGHGVRRRMAERWVAMTPEERERFRHGLRERWGCGPSGSETRES